MRNEKGDLKVFEIKKAVADKFGLTEYRAVFYTDNKLFTKCELTIYGGLTIDYMDMYEKRYSTTVKCDPSDTFNLYVGHAASFEKCMDKFMNSIIVYNYGSQENRPRNMSSNPGANSRWGNVLKHFTRITERYDETLSKVCDKGDKK